MCIQDGNLRIGTYLSPKGMDVIFRHDGGGTQGAFLLFHILFCVAFSLRIVYTMYIRQKGELEYDNDNSEVGK